MCSRLCRWLLPEILDWARGKTRSEIMAELSNGLEAIACIEPQYLPFLGSDLRDSRVYSSMSYFIDHVVNHHPEVPIADYGRLQAILDSPDNVLLDERKRNRSLIFVKQYEKIGTVVVSVDRAKSGAIVLHKSLFNQRKNSYAKLSSVGVGSHW